MTIAPHGGDRPPPAALAWAYAGTILASAFLLFQVQPLISKVILPWFGGSPAVWTTCMLCFQVLLFGGYAYAHLTERFLSVRVQSVVHLALLFGCLALLPITPDPSWKPTDGGDPVWRIIRLLAVTVGVPYFALSTTGPLLQAWFSRSYPGRSPYRLYALSNLGSLVALASYPFVVEPLLSSRAQTRIWSWSFGPFVAACAYCTFAARRYGRPNLPTAGQTGREAAPGWSRRLAWVALPAFASLVLLATTNHVCQDVAVIPFLWVVPLGLYLLTFIISFDHERWYLRRWFAAAGMLLTLVVALLNDPPISLGFLQELLLYFAAMFVVCMVCHGELVRLRPGTQHLTSFYLMIAAGGALGGIFVSLVAPLIFSTFLEWKIALAGGYLLGAVVLWRSAGQDALKRRWPATAAAAAVAILGFLSLMHYQSWFDDTVLRTQMGSLYNEDYRCKVRATTRSFYGVVTVLERFGKDDDRHDFAMFNGQIPHGVQLADPAHAQQPTTYYGAATGMAQGLARFANRADARVAVIGLGVGTIAAYARPGQTMRFYEINPDVVFLATRYFTFLSHSRGQVELVLGDARLSLERELLATGRAPFDAVVLDAFSGDAIPTHLLTQEAFEIYLRHLAPDGAILVHVSNKYLDLIPVVRGLADHNGLQAVRVLTHGDDGLTTYRADWMVLSKNAPLLDELRSLEQVADGSSWSVLWTDDHSNLFQILR